MENEIKGSIRDFILGGNANFTIFQEPNIQAKYLVKSNATKNCWFVSAELDDKSTLSGVTFTNGRNLVYQGYFTGSLDFKAGKKGVEKYNEKAINALLWVLRHSSNLPSKVHVFHHGKCSVCGRKLTDAESLASGVGPTCRKKVGV